MTRRTERADTAHRPLRWVGSPVLVAVLVATLAGGCAKPAASPPTATRVAPHGSTAAVDPAAWALADRLTGPTYTADTTAALVAVLARSGVATFAGPGAAKPEQPVTGPVNALRLLDFQAHALAVGAWAGTAYTGAELDATLPAPADAATMPTASEILAGYVAAARTPGGAVARALMTGQNLFVPRGLRFPTLVLVLFLADLAAESAPSSPPAASGLAPARLMLAADQRLGGGICSAAAHWINDTTAGFFNALRLSTPDSLPGTIVVSIWNWLVGAAEAFIHHLISTLTDAVLATIRTIAFGFSEVADQLISLLPYAVRVTAAGDSGGGATFTLGEQPQAGHFTAVISAGDLPAWPPILADCADVAKIRLPRFEALGIPLTWGQLEAPADLLLAPTDLDARGRGTAYLVYHGGRRPPPTPAPAASGCGAGRLEPGTYSGTNTNTFVETIPMTGGAAVDHNDATGPVAMTVAADGSVTGQWSYTSHEVFKEDAEISGVSLHHGAESTWTMSPGTVTGTVCDLDLTSGTLTRTSCTGDCGAEPPPASQAALKPMGAPISVSGRHATWRWLGNGADGAYTDTFTFTVG